VGRLCRASRNSARDRRQAQRRVDQDIRERGNEANARTTRIRSVAAVDTGRVHQANFRRSDLLDTGREGVSRKGGLIGVRHRSRSRLGLLAAVRQCKSTKGSHCCEPLNDWLRGQD